MKREELGRCEGRVNSSVGDPWRPRLCSRRATVERDGKRFCALHDPEARKQRGEERYAALKARFASEAAAITRGQILRAIGEKAVELSRAGEALPSAIVELISSLGKEKEG